MPYKTHHLKIWQMYADDVVGLRKNFEIRKNDRDFHPGDHIVFKVVDMDKNETPVPDHPLNNGEFEITYVLTGNAFPQGIVKGYAVLGIRPI